MTLRRWLKKYSTQAVSMLIALAALMVAGCEPPNEGVQVAATPPPAMEAPDLEFNSRIGLIRQRGKLRVGDSYERAMDLFQAPRRAREFRDLPSRFAAPYRAEGWESNSEGFGVILYESRVAAAVHTWEQATDEQVDELVAAYQSEMRSMPETVVGESGSYWFWEMPRRQEISVPAVPQETQQPVKHRLMVVAVRSNGGWNLTESMGDVFAMNALKANPIAAKKDLDAADAVLRASTVREQQ